AQVQQLGWGLYHYVWNNEGALELDARTGRWRFQANVLPAAAKAGYLYYGVAPRRATGPEEQPTLEDLTRTEKEFDVEHLAYAITKHRMERLAKVLVEHTKAQGAALRLTSQVLV